MAWVLVMQLNIFGEINEETKYDNIEIIDDIGIKVNYGDLYKLGNHYLMCGDSTIDGDVFKLLNKNNVDILFTDPPYNVGFNGRSGDFDVIINDNLDVKQFEIFINKVINVIKKINPKSYYVWCNWKFYSILQDKLDYKACIVWAKNNFGMGIGYRHQHEFCLFGGYIKEAIKNETDLWYHDKDIKYLHPTQKPISLAVRAIKNSSNKNDIVLDLFGGSGSTLLACELTNRINYTMELDPKYCELIINRYYVATGKKGVKI